MIVRRNVCMKKLTWREDKRRVLEGTRQHWYCSRALVPFGTIFIAVMAKLPFLLLASQGWWVSRSEYFMAWIWFLFSMLAIYCLLFPYSAYFVNEFSPRLWKDKKRHWLLLGVYFWRSFNGYDWKKKLEKKFLVVVIKYLDKISWFFIYS
jgi:hypothetical protein